MAQNVARAAQVIGWITIGVAFLLAIWTIVDVANDDFRTASLGRIVIDVLANSLAIAAAGMLAVLFGALLERFDRAL